MNFSECDGLHFPPPLPCPVALREVVLAIGEKDKHDAQEDINLLPCVLRCKI